MLTEGPWFYLDIRSCFNTIIQLTMLTESPWFYLDIRSCFNTVIQLTMLTEGPWFYLYISSCFNLVIQLTMLTEGPWFNLDISSCFNTVIQLTMLTVCVVLSGYQLVLYTVIQLNNANGMSVFYPDYSSQLSLLTESPWFYPHMSLISVGLWKVRGSTRMSVRT
jgi:hypothetical protein